MSMWSSFGWWLGARSRSRPIRTRRPAKGWTPRLEQLEDRCVPTLATPTLSAIPNVTSVALGTTSVTLKDTATLAGGSSPTAPSGTITFTLFLGSTQVDSETATVTGDGSFSTPTGYTIPTAATGTYQWDASYSGDANNNPVSDTNSTNEQVTVSAGGATLASTTLASTPSETTSATTSNATTGTLGTSSVVFKDTAVLSGSTVSGSTPTGTITFTLYYNGGSTPVDTETATVSGNVSYATPKGYTLPTTATATGTYQWDVSYSGDGNNNAVSDTNNATEQVVTNPASPTLTTTPSTSTSTITGGPGGAGGTTTVTLSTTAPTLTDSATLAGGYFESGTITFYLFAPGVTPNATDSNAVDTEIATVNGNGTYTTPTGYTLSTTGTVAGTYQWDATYSGDGNNTTVSDNGKETMTVNPATTTLTSTAGATVLAGSGSKLTDSVTLSGYSPSGYILFTLTAPGSSTVLDEEIVGVTSATTTYSTTKDYVPTAAGTYTWTAKYSGDGNNKSVSSTATEVVQAGTTPTLTTKPGATVVLSTPKALTDSATLAGGAKPTGTLAFFLFGPGVTPNATDSNNVYSDAIAITGNGTYTTSTASGSKVGGFTPSGSGTLAGTYEWVVTYSGDAKNNAVSNTSGTETVSVASPKLITTPGGAVMIGSGTNMNASATVTGGFSPGGSILFTLTAPNGTIVYTDIVTVTSNSTFTTASGTSPGGYAPTTVGTYEWAVSYTGDGNNNGASIKANSDPQTANLHPNTPTLTTTPGGTLVFGSGARLTDSVKLTGGASPTGTITFYLFAPGVAPNATDSNAVYSDAVTITAGTSTYSTSKGTNPGGYLPGGTGTYDWVVSYSGDSSNNPVSTISAADPNGQAEIVNPAPSPPAPLRWQR